MSLPRTISSAIDKIARQALGKDWSLYSALLAHWSEIVGTEYARVTTPVKISFPPRQREARRGGGTLVIRIPKGLAMEFTFKIGQIRERITSYFGYEAISKITFEPFYEALKDDQEPSPPPDPEVMAKILQEVNGLEDHELREALESFCETAIKPRK